MANKKAIRAKKVGKGRKVRPLKPVRHARISFKRGRLVCSPPTIRADRGDTIAWTISRNYPFGIFIKSSITPLGHHAYLTSLKPNAKKVILAQVSPFAPSGCYPYAIGAYDGKKVLILDPDIIVPKPKG